MSQFNQNAEPRAQRIKHIFVNPIMVGGGGGLPPVLFPTELQIY